MISRALGRGLASRWSIAAVFVAATLLAGAGATPAGLEASRAWQDTEPRWSPDGRWIAFHRNEVTGVEGPATTIWIVRADGTRQRRIGVGPVLTAPTPPSWSPDAREVAFAALDGIAAVEVATGKLRLIVPTRGAFAPVRSPDGTQIAFRVAGELHVAHSDGSGDRTVAMGLHDTTLPQWSPDGASLAYAGTGSDTKDVFVVDTRTGVRANLGRPGAADEKPVWSPDGSEVAFESDRSGRRGVYAARPDGSGVRLVVDPSLAPRDVSWQGDVLTLTLGGEGLWTVRPDGSGRSRIARREDVLGPALRSPGGVALVYAAGDPCGRYGVHVLVPGALERRITNPCSFRGTSGPDVLRGSHFPDTIRSLGGDDRILDAGGRDRIDTGPGNDVVLARDQNVDLITCGPGRDRAVVDRRDVVTGCERTERPR